MSDIHITGYRAHKVRITEEGVRVEFKSAGGDITALVLHQGELKRVDINGLYNIDNPQNPSTASLESYEKLTEKFIKGIAAHIHKNELGHTAIRDLVTHLTEWQPRFTATRKSQAYFDVQKVITTLGEHQNAGGVKELPSLIEGYKALQQTLEGLPDTQEAAVEQAQSLLRQGDVLSAQKYEHVRQLMIGLPSRMSRTLEPDFSPIVEQIQERLETSPNTHWSQGALEFIKSPEKEGRQEYLDAHYPPNKSMRMVTGSILPKEKPVGEIIR